LLAIVVGTGFAVQLGQPGAAVERFATDHIGGQTLADLEDQRVVGGAAGGGQQPRIGRGRLGGGRRAEGARRP